MAEISKKRKAVAEEEKSSSKKLTIPGSMPSLEPATQSDENLLVVESDIESDNEDEDIFVDMNDGTKKWQNPEGQLSPRDPKSPRKISIIKIPDQQATGGYKDGGSSSDDSGGFDIFEETSTSDIEYPDEEEELPYVIISQDIPYKRSSNAVTFDDLLQYFLHDRDSLSPVNKEVQARILGGNLLIRKDRKETPKEKLKVSDLKCGSPKAPRTDKDVSPHGGNISPSLSSPDLPSPRSSTMLSGSGWHVGTPAEKSASLPESFLGNWRKSSLRKSNSYRLERGTSNNFRKSSSSIELATNTWTYPGERRELSSSDSHYRTLASIEVELQSEKPQVSNSEPSKT